MIYRYIKAIVAILLVMLSLSSCSLIEFFSAESLLRPPKLTGENAALQTAFENEVGSDVSLYAPIAGDYRSSYIFFDLNSDGYDEAVVFYSMITNPSVVHMHLLTHRDGQWYSLADITGSGTDVYKIDFCNIDSSHNFEIAVIWSLDDSKKEKTLSFYRVDSIDIYADGNLSSIATIQISDCLFIDIDNDLSGEILYLYYSDASSPYYLSARLIDYNESEKNFVPISEIPFHGDISSILHLEFDKENTDYRFYFECISPDNLIFTELIVYSSDNGALFIPEADGRYISDYTKRPYKYFSTDFNKDGYIDLPFYFESPESYSVSGEDNSPLQLIFTEWNSYFDGEFTSLGKYFVNDIDGFMLKFDELCDNFYIVYDEINKVTQVRLKDSDDENNIVFSVSVSRDSVNEHLLLGDTFLTDRNQTDFNITISAKGKSMSFTEAYVKSLIYII